MKKPSPSAPVDRVDWPALFPVLRLLPAPLEALRPGRLLAGLVWVLLVWGGSRLVDTLDSSAPFAEFLKQEGAALGRLVSSVVHFNWLDGAIPALVDMVGLPAAFVRAHPLLAVPGFLWLLAATLLCGAVVSRASALQVAGQRAGYFSLWQVALFRLPSLMLSPVMAVVALLAIWGVLAVAGWVFFSGHWTGALLVLLVGLAGAAGGWYLSRSSATVVRALLVGVPAILVLVGVGGVAGAELATDTLAFVGAVAFGPFFLLGLAGTLIFTAWLVASPLFVPAAMVDGADGFDAPARALAYGVFRFGPWVRLLLMLVVLAGIAIAIAAAFHSAAVQVTGTMVGSGAKPFLANWLPEPAAEGHDETIAAILGCWRNILGALVAGYGFSLALTGFTRAYLLLRETCDGVAPSEVWPQEEALGGRQRRWSWSTVMEPETPAAADGAPAKE